MNNALKSYVDFFNEFDNNSFVGILDTDLKFVAIGKKLASYFNLPQSYFLGLSVLDDISVDRNNLEYKTNILNNTCKNAISSSYIGTHAGSHIKIGDFEVSSMKIAMCIIDPIIYHDTPIGIRFSAQKIDYMPNFDAMTAKAHHMLKSLNLTPREKEVAYLKAQNKSAEEITHIISQILKKDLAVSTIKSIITKQLYVKLGVDNQFQFMEKATKIGLNLMVPDTLITKNTIIITSQNQAIFN